MKRSLERCKHMNLLTQSKISVRNELMNGHTWYMVKSNITYYSTCEYFEQNDEENVSICDLIGKMQEYLDGSGEDAYNRKFMIEKLKENYGDEVIISSRRGQGISNVLTLRESADKVLGMYYKKPKDVDAELQKRDIIEAAAKTLKVTLNHQEPRHLKKSTHQ